MDAITGLLDRNIWRRETLVKGVGPGGLLGEVVYITPCGKQLWNLDSVREGLPCSLCGFQMCVDKPAYARTIRPIDSFFVVDLAVPIELEKLREFFLQLVKDQRRLEDEKEAQLKKNRRTQLEKLKEQRIEKLIQAEMKRPVEDLRLLNQEVSLWVNPLNGQMSDIFVSSLLRSFFSLNIVHFNIGHNTVFKLRRNHA
ncbi:unnamed protein product [Dibothriocephalus latus]|uniref:Uncharacterized protein n=1 Tax=Dibothriocephalus latus TaxID=60516 RepID=A0A3P7NYH4_DIBLA|nr:unnamed protein product [Dibothriocephalus latus]